MRPVPHSLPNTLPVTRLRAFGGARACVSMCARAWACVCVCVRASGRVYVCVCSRARARVCICVIA